MVNSSFSSWTEAPSGVPQGSVLGPVLFLIFTLFLNECITSSISKYFADDTKLYKIIKSQADCLDLQNDLTNIVQWFTDNGLSTNASKCVVLRIGKCDIDYKYRIGDTLLDFKPYVKDLGVLVDNHLSFKTHSEQVAKKLAQIIGTICRTFDSNNLRVKAVQCYGLPTVDYCSSVCTPVNSEAAELIEGVFHRFTKRLLYPKLYFSTIEGGSYAERLSQLNLVSLETRRLQNDLIFAHKIYLNCSDLRFEDFFTTSKKLTRGPSHKLISVKCKTDQFRYSFFNRIIPFWNVIPSNIVSASHNEFKNFVRANPCKLEKYLPSVVRRRNRMT